MAKVTLALISPDKKTAQPLIDKYGHFFDAVVTELAPNCKDFATARNRMSAKVKTPYYLWVDTDDEIENPDRIKKLVQQMEDNRLDLIYFKYDYGYNEEQELVAEHWRERLVRTSHPFKWVGVVHETLISESQPSRAKNDEVKIKHTYKNYDDIMKSAHRNHEIMTDAYNKGDKDSRLLYYLGRSFFMMGDFDQSASFMLEYTKVSGWDEQKYDAYIKIADCMIMKDQFDQAFNACFEAIKVKSDWPDAYIKIGDIYLGQGQFEKAIDWIEDGISRKQPETMEIIDPTAYTYRPLTSLALAYFQLAKIDIAYEVIQKAAKFKPQNKAFNTAFIEISEAYAEELAIRSARGLAKVVESEGKLKEYLESLPSYIQTDMRLREFRNKVYPPKKWGDKSVVIYAGEQWEDWGPDTLDKGMGGSEEAVVYLSRELANLGYKVTVYNQRSEEFDDDGVIYMPWELFNPEDEFNIFIAWRSPMLAPSLKIKAKFKGVDMHDSPLGHQALPARAKEYNDVFFFKSQYQRDLVDLPDEKCAIINNGIVPSQFEGEVKRNPHKVIFGSSADRGLDVLLEMWPDVKKEVPDAELVWAYGWNSFDGLHKGNTTQMKWKWQMKKKMNEVGAKELGRLSHEELAKEFMSSGVWAYPTSFTEISCITAMKAQAAGCQIVTSGYAALKSTIFQDEEEIVNIHLNPEKLDEFKKRLIKALKEPKEVEDVRQRALEQFSWEGVARQWAETFKVHTIAR